MIEPEEMKARLLATLEEAGNEWVNALINTVIDPTGDPSETQLFSDALIQLVSADFITVRMSSLPHGRQDFSKTEGLSELAKIADHYVFDVNEKIWSDARRTGPPYFQTPEPEVVLTDLGQAKAVELLDQRGYEWWTTDR